MVTVDPALPDGLQDAVDSALRVVATHEKRDHTLLYNRDDVREDCTDEELDRIFDDLVLEGMERDHFEKLFHIGELECGAGGFEEAVAFYFPSVGYSGLVVSLDYDGPIDIDGVTKSVRMGTKTRQPDTGAKTPFRCYNSPLVGGFGVETVGVRRRELFGQQVVRPPLPGPFLRVLSDSVPVFLVQSHLLVLPVLAHPPVYAA